MNIVYVRKGNALKPVGAGNKMILHCCNDQGAWGAGFVLALSRMWILPEAHYHDWHRGAALNDDAFALGQAQMVKVEEDIIVVNMIGQHKTGPDHNGFPPVRYWALDECFKKVASVARNCSASIHVPYLMGCALAGGEWDYIAAMLKKRFLDEDIAVYAYDIAGLRGE